MAPAISKLRRHYPWPILSLDSSQPGSSQFAAHRPADPPAQLRELISMSLRLALIALIVLAIRPTLADEPAVPSEVAAAIRSAAEKYVEASNRGDAKALRAAWTVDGDYVDAAGIRTRASELFAEVTARPAEDATARSLEVELLSLRLVKPDVALEDGIATRSIGEEPSTRSRYTAVWVKLDNRWLLDAVREESVEENAPDNPLQDIAWMVGTWTGELDGSKVLVRVRWLEDRKFLERDLTIKRDGKKILHSTQRIGWDAAAEEIKSWTFDSQGSHAEAAWTNDGDTWNVDTLGVLGDGREVHSTSKLKRNPDGSITWTLIDPAATDAKAAEIIVPLRCVD